MKKKKKIYLLAKDLDLIIEEFNKPEVDSYNTIRSVLALCPKRIKVQFALDFCNSIRHLMKDKRSTDALDAIQVYLDTGRPVPEDVRADAASAASAAYTASAAYATSAAAAAAAAAAAYAAYAAYADAAAYTADAAAYAASASADAVAYADAAAAYTAYADAAAAYASRNSPEWKRIKDEKTREHLNRLKELILQHVPAKYDNFLLQVAM